MSWHRAGYCRRVCAGIGFCTWVALMCSSVSANDVYITGYVKNRSNERGIEDATVVIIHENQRLFSIRTGQKGWFETPSPLSPEHIGKELSISVFKRGYSPELDAGIVLKATGNSLNLLLTPMADYALEDDDAYLNDVVYGYVFDVDTMQPVQGALIKLQEKDSVSPIASAVTRGSGYFSLYVPATSEEESKEYTFSAEHYERDTKSGSARLEVADDVWKIGLAKRMYSFSIGPALHLQTTGRVADEETGGAVLLNFSWYPRKLNVVNRLYPRYAKSGFVGFDLAFGAIPFLDASTNSDQIDAVKVYALGVSYAVKKLPVPLRAGLAYTDTDKTAIYLGINVPLFYF